MNRKREKMEGCLEMGFFYAFGLLLDISFDFII